MADYQLPSSFVGGMQGASNALSAGKLPQGVQSPILKQILPTPKPVPVDPNKSPEVFKKRFIEKYGDGVAEDGRKYSAIPAPEIVAKVIRKYGDGNTTDGIPYREFLPRPASPNDSLEYRLKQIESLSTAPKSQFYTTGGIRGQTEQEKKFTTAVTKRENEGEIVKTLKAPYRGLESVGQNLAYGTFGAGADVVDMFGGDKLADKMRKSVEKEKFQSGMLSQNKGLIGGMQSGDLSSVIETLSSGAGYLATGAKIPLYLTALSQGGNLSQEGEEQGQGTLGDKAIAYTTGGISAAIERMSGQKVIGGMMRAGIKKETATTFVQKMNNYLKGLKPSDFEAGTEVIQQGIENIGRSTMGVDYDKGIQQYFEAGLLGKILGKVGDKLFSESPVTVLPPAPPKSVTKNLEVIQTIKTGIGGNKVLKQAKSRGFDPELDIATYEDLKPTITNDGRVNTDVAQENIQNFIEPYQEKLDNAIAQEGEFIPADAFRAEILKELESEKSNIRTYKSWVSAANDAVDTAVENFGDENGNIPLSEVNNIKKKLGQNNNYTDPNITLDKTIARAAKQIVENYTKSADVKSLNNDLARWYTTRDYLQILGSGTKTVKGGRLGKYAARLAGVVIGSQLGPIAGMVGGEVAAKLQSKMMQGALKGTKQAMPEMKSFGNIKKKQQLLLPPPSGKQTSASVVDVKPMTGFAPGVLQKSESAISRQISGGNMEGTVSQSQPVSVLEGIRKRVIVIPKKESSGKKVNNSIIQKLKEKKTEVKANLPKTPKKKEIDFSVKYKTEADRIAHEEALAKGPITKTIYKAGDKGTPQDAIDKEFGLKRKTPQEGKTEPSLSDKGGVLTVKPENQAKFNQGDSYEPVRVIMSDKDAAIVRHGALRNKMYKNGTISPSDRLNMSQIEKNLGMTYEEIKARSEEIKKLAREARSKTEEVILDLTKKKSALPQLKEKKNNIVEGLKKAKVDTELESLQKIQESMPGVPSIEVPKDYTPIGGLPTGTEFEAPIISSISKTKGKLPSPEIKRPQIRGFDLSTRSSMLESLKEQGMFTDSFFVVKDKNVSNKLFEYAEKKAIKKGNPTSGTKVDMKALVERAENGADTLLTPKEYMKLGKENGVYLRMDIGNGNQVAVNASYADIFFKNFDDVTFKGNNELSPVVVLSKGEPVGVIMPIKDVYNLKDKIGDFSMQNKTPQVEGKTEPRIISVKKNWKEVIDTPEFASRKDNILVSLANDSKSSTELTDVLNRVDKGMANESSIYWAISQNPNASAATKLRAADLYEKSYTSGYHDKPNLPKTPQGGKTVPKEILDEMKKYDNAEDFAKGVLKSGVEETKGLGEAKILRKSIEDIKTKALGLDKSSPEFVALDKEFGRLTKELSAIDGEDALTKVLGKNEYDLEKNIETLKKLYNDNKPKPFLPLSQKLEVKYSKPDTLVQEARKYDYANGFISDYYKKPNILNWGGPETLEGGLPKIKQRGALFLAENSTDGKNYAEGYAKLSSLTGKSKVHQIELDETAKIFDIRNKKDRELLKSKLDEYTYSQLNKRGKAIDWKEIEPIISDIKSLGYDGVIVLERPKGHILDGANGKYKSMADINSVAIFNPDKIKKAKTNSELLDIYNKANKSKSSLPMSAKSEVKYSKPDTLVQEARKYKSAEDYIKAQGEPVYHGGVDIVGGRPFLKQAKTVKGDGTTSDSSMLFFSDKKEVADFFAENRKMIKKGNSEVIQGTLDRSKILNFGGTNETFGKALSNLGYDIKTLKVKNGDITNLFDDKAFTDKLREKGYNGISISEKGGTTFGIIDDNVFKNRTENLYEYSKYIADTADKKLLPNAKNYSTPEDYAEGLNYARKNPIGRTANSLGGEVSIGKPSTKEGLMVMGDGTHTVIKIGDNEIYVKGDMEGSTYYLSNIYINNKGTGLGTKFMEKLKESADIYGFDITISKVSNQNFFDKFNWLKGNSYKSETSFSHTKQQLLDIYNKANKSKSSLPMSAKSEVKYSKPDLASEAKKYKDGSEFYERATGDVRKKMKEEGIVYKSQYEEFFDKNVKTPKVEILDTVNPTGSLFVDYTPQKRANSTISSKDLTTLDKTLGKSPDDYITIYRGTVKGQKEMNPGDFVTDLLELAKSYAGGNKIVISKRVKYSDVIDSKKDGGANEYLYIPKEMQKWDKANKK